MVTRRRKKKPSDQPRKAIHVALFEQRHVVPAYVKQAIFDLKPLDPTTGKFGWDPLDHEAFYNAACEKFFRWKAEGYTDVVIYLSGLIGATLEVINAATEAEMHLKFMHFSYNTGRWIAQYMLEKPGHHIEYTQTEKDIRANESDISAKTTPSEDRFYRKYAQSYNAMLLHYMQSTSKGTFDWEAEKKYCYTNYYASNDDALEFCIYHILKIDEIPTTEFYPKLRAAVVGGQFKAFYGNYDGGSTSGRRK